MQPKRKRAPTLPPAWSPAPATREGSEGKAAAALAALHAAGCSHTSASPVAGPRCEAEEHSACGSSGGTPPPSGSGTVPHLLPPHLLELSQQMDCLPQADILSLPAGQGYLVIHRRGGREAAQGGQPEPPPTPRQQGREQGRERDPPAAAWAAQQELRYQRTVRLIRLVLHLRMLRTQEEQARDSVAAARGPAAVAAVAAAGAACETHGGALPYPPAMQPCPLDLQLPALWHASAPFLQLQLFQASRQPATPQLPPLQQRKYHAAFCIPAIGGPAPAAAPGPGAPLSAAAGHSAKQARTLRRQYARLVPGQCRAVGALTLEAASKRPLAQIC